MTNEADTLPLANAEPMLRRLSVFAGTFSREAMIALSADDPYRDHADDVLDQLVARTLVIVESGDEAVRYRLPDDRRTALHAELVARDDAEEAYDRLLVFATALAEQVLAAAFGPERAVWMRRLEREHANLAALLGWLVAQGDAERGLQLADLLQELWFEEMHTSEGRMWFARLLALPQAAARTTQRAQALDLAGALALNQGDYAPARALKEEALSILRETGDAERLAYALLHMGHLIGYAQGDLYAAQDVYQEGLELFQAQSHAEGTAHALANLATVAILLGDYVAAQPLAIDSLRRYRALGFVYDMALSLGREAGIAAGIGQPERALRLAGASAAHCDRIGVSQPAVFRQRGELMIARARQALSPATQEALWAEGQTMTLEQAVADALREPHGEVR
jgi:tetratricopeptide (TPR) repeat protein